MDCAWVYVDCEKEATDLYIMNHVKKHDLVITQDIGLASTLLAKGVIVISPKGIRYDEQTIITALDLRYLSAKARRQGMYGKGPKAYSKKDRITFKQELEEICRSLKGLIDI